MINVGIIGATGYVGIEIARILSAHPGFKITSAVSQSFAGKRISDVYPALNGILDLELESLSIEKICANTDFFITALPHGVSGKIIPELARRGKRIIDHSADFRYRNTGIYEKWYKAKHQMPELNELAVYGLPELYREKIKSARITANPGCYPTASILGIAPLLAEKVISTEGIIVDAASGISGAGRKTDLPYQYCEASENFKAYGIAVHRHTSEIEQEMSLLAGKEILVSFTPHLLPMKRGLLATIYAGLEGRYSTGKLLDLYKTFYRDEFFVRILKEGMFPETRYTSGSNFIDIGLAVDERLNRVVIISSIDNLGKGAASQAVQCLNIMNGLPENAGIERAGMFI